jgi:hypothetical protein
VAIRSSAVARLSLDFIVAPPMQVSRSFRSRRSHPRQTGPEQPTRSGRSLFPATPMISGAAIAVGYRLRRESPLAAATQSIQNNSDLAQGPLPIRPSKVRRKLPHVAAELIGWENSDAQDHRVFRCRRFDRDWVRSMGGLARTKAPVSPSIGQGIEPHQLMVNAKDLSRAEFVDYTFVFH